TGFGRYIHIGQVFRHRVWPRWPAITCWGYLRRYRFRGCRFWRRRSRLRPPKAAILFSERCFSFSSLFVFMIIIYFFLTASGYKGRGVAVFRLPPKGGI